MSNAQKVERVERGWAGHFCCSNSCRYRRNTLLTLGELRVVVSSVGCMCSSDAIRKIVNAKPGIPEEIGYNRHYETMAFLAHRDGEYWEADVARQVSVDAAWSLKWSKEVAGKIDSLADRMHEDYIGAVTRMMLEGTLIAGIAGDGA